MKSVLSNKVEVRASSINKKGMFAKEYIHAGEMVYIKGGHMYNLLSSGQVVDTILDARDILSYTKGSVLWGYFSSIVVHPDYRQHGIATEMLFCWSDLIIRLAIENSIYFKKIVADAVSDVGAHLLSEMGFSFVRSSKHESKIMTLDLFEKNTIDSKFSEKLLTVYQKYNGG